MSIFPGLCGDLAVTPYRVFLGTLPTLGVEERFLRQMQAVFPWYTSRKRVKEQASEYLEVDLASVDPELFLRYTHVHYVRRQLHDELVDKQLTLLETGKAPKPAEPALLVCLTDCDARMASRAALEWRQLESAKRQCRVPGRRELSPDTPLEAFDVLCMMRVVEEDVGGVETERVAQSFLPRALAEKKAAELSASFALSSALDKKAGKLLSRMIPGDYNKIGSIEKLRPADVTTLYRFHGERAAKQSGSYFKQCLWGHVFRKYATHPSYLRSASMYWARYSGLDSSARLSTLPADIAGAACLQQSLFPALRFHAQYLYTSPEIARQQWKIDKVIPLMRLFPLCGAPAAEDLCASMAVEAEWARLQIGADSDVLSGDVIRSLKEAIEQVAGLYDTNLDAVCKRVEEGAKVVCPPLTEEEVASLAGDAEDSASQSAAA